MDLWKPESEKDMKKVLEALEEQAPVFKLMNWVHFHTDLTNLGTKKVGS